MQRRRHSQAKKPVDKRGAILDAALTEFAKHGFSGTSTNAIAARARVAKGLVFHHFDSKEALFVAVVDDVAGYFGRRMDEFVKAAPADLFERVLGWAQVKLEIIAEDPRRLRVLVNALSEAPVELKAEIRARAESMARPRMASLLQGVDTTRLRSGVTVQEAVDVLMLLSSGFESRFLPLMSARTDKGAGILERAMADTRRMFELLRDGIYGARK
jgi:AcrR family transcriptional regulator